MNWMRTVVMALVVTLAANLTTMAQDGAAGEAPKVKKEAPPLVAVSVTGKVVEEKGVQKRKDKEVPYTKYWLELEDGKKMPIAQPKAMKKGEKPVVNLADYVGKKVTIKGQGVVSTTKNKAGVETVKTTVKTIEAVEEITE